MDNWSFRNTIFFIASYGIKRFFVSLAQINNIIYYWLCMTVLTEYGNQLI